MRRIFLSRFWVHNRRLYFSILRNILRIYTLHSHYCWIFTVILTFLLRFLNFYVQIFFIMRFNFTVLCIITWFFFYFDRLLFHLNLLFLILMRMTNWNMRRIIRILRFKEVQTYLLIFWIFIFVLWVLT
jgi:hypothetical protein